MLGMFVQGSVDDALPGISFPLPGNRGIGITLYTAAACTKGAIKMVTYGSTNAAEVVASTPATNTTVLRRVVVALEDIAAGTVGKFQWLGECEAANIYTATAGEYLEVLNSGTYLVVDDTGANKTVQSCAISLEANSATAAALKKIWLFGEPCQIQAT
jgi:hypothetical protein